MRGVGTWDCEGYLSAHVSQSPFCQRILCCRELTELNNTPKAPFLGASQRIGGSSLGTVSAGFPGWLEDVLSIRTLLSASRITHNCSHLIPFNTYMSFGKCDCTHSVSLFCGAFLFAEGPRIMILP